MGRPRKQESEEILAVLASGQKSLSGMATELGKTIEDIMGRVRYLRKSGFITQHMTPEGYAFRINPDGPKKRQTKPGEPPIKRGPNGGVIVELTDRKMWGSGGQVGHKSLFCQSSILATNKTSD